MVLVVLALGLVPVCGVHVLLLLVSLLGMFCTHFFSELRVIIFFLFCLY